MGLDANQSFLGFFAYDNLTILRDCNDGLTARKKWGMRTPRGVRIPHHDSNVLYKHLFTGGKKIVYGDRESRQQTRCRLRTG